MFIAQTVFDHHAVKMYLPTALFCVNENIGFSLLRHPILDFEAVLRISSLKMAPHSGLTVTYSSDVLLLYSDMSLSHTIASCIVWSHNQCDRMTVIICYFLLLLICTIDLIFLWSNAREHRHGAANFICGFNYSFYDTTS